MEIAAMADRHTEELRTFSHLAGLLSEEFPRAVLNRRLRVVIGEDALSCVTGQILALTVARLAPRFCHRIDFVVAQSAACLNHLRDLLAADRFESDSLADLARLVWQDGDFTADGGGPVDLTLGIGAAGDISLGVERGGAALVLVDGIAHIDQRDAPFAALVAAALGCAQTAKGLYPEILSGRRLGAIRFDQAALGGPLDLERPVVLERPVFAGVGAVGCAALYALIVAGAVGSVLLLDPDSLKDSNLMRYILFDSRHLGMPKVEAAQAIVAASGLELTVDTNRSVIQEFLKQHEEERQRARLVVSAVDTYEARREIASGLPLRVMNAGTTPRDFTISRHGFGDGYACLACLYPARQQDVETDAVMAREMGLEKQEVLALRRKKTPLTLDLVRRVATARGLADDHYASYAGEPLDSFYNKEFCATTPVQTSRGEAVAPLAYGSALAGILLGQLIANPSAGDLRRFRMDVMTGLDTPQRTAPRPRAGCPYCGSETLQSVYRSKWEPETDSDMTPASRSGDGGRDCNEEAQAA